jgi:sterol desaturase/sphingolipid hydroxylase (fatty acid hydroxylase superfamily)
MPFLQTWISNALAFGSSLAERIGALLLLPGSSISLSSLASALFVAALFLLIGRRRRREVPLKVLLRAMFPRRIVFSRSTRVDLGFLLFNVVVQGGIFGLVILSQAGVSRFALETLEPLIGKGPGPVLGATATLVVSTVALFLAAEFGYWIDHWTSHKVPFFWEFHKAHHSAEVLTPLTNFRVHPVEGMKFANILAVTMGLTDAALTWGLGEPAKAFTVFDRNILGLAGLYLIQHLQHTHLWLIAPGPLGRVIYSPAHHQIHHSSNPEHFGKNLGAFLTLWDWMFGTLHTPAKTRERLVFGLRPEEASHHTLLDAMVQPVVKAAKMLQPSALRPAPRRRPYP